MIISYISAVYNKADDLLQTLNHVRNQDNIDPAAVEFILADDCSSDSSLAILKAEAARDPRLTIIENDQNAGPAIRFNQAARRAKGRFLLPFDADDLVPANASAVLLKTAAAFKTELVFGKSRRSTACPRICEPVRVTTSADPLAFTARRKVVRMGFLASSSLWERAGGCDEGVFIQDQSLPLRLAAKAGSLAFIEDYIYHLRETGANNLSRNILQQHHDRLLALAGVVRQPGLSRKAHRALIRQAVSTVWKIRRDGGHPLPHLSAEFARYLVDRLSLDAPSYQWLEREIEKLALLPGIRRYPFMQEA